MESTIAIVGVIIVFVALVALFIVFKVSPKLINRKTEQASVGENRGQNEITDLSGETAAAISAAVHMYLDQRHDEEMAILTINQVSKAYSPWSSKIYGTHNNLVNHRR